MSLHEQRPNPDALLAQLQQLETQALRGKLRIYFGSSAGVGKTYAMLEAARYAHEAGRKVLVGVVETHGRAETEKLLEGLELLPRKNIDYKDRTFQVFDLDAALVQKPEILLVDELAYSNAVGGRHPKRWQDIEELLNNGIEVWTTLNVQHLDSLNDVVGNITGIRVMETIPDRFFNQADEVVLIDIPATELLNRLKLGKVYLSEHAQRAAQHFFRPGNLIALREITLRRVADRLEKDIRSYKQTQAINNVWKTESSLLASLNDDDNIEAVIRRAARLAGQMNLSWHAVYVETPALQRRPSDQRQRILTLLKLAEQLGAQTTILSGDAIAPSLIHYAQQHNLTTVILGRTSPSYWKIGSRSLAAQLGQLAPEIDVVQVGSATVSRPMTATVEVVPTPIAHATSEQTMRGIGLAGLATFITTLLTTTLLETLTLDPANLVMIHLLAVVLVAVKLGRKPAVVATVLNVIAFDFFLIPPRFSLAVSDIQYLLTFAVMLVVGLIISHLTSGLRFQARIAAHREQRAQILFELAKELSGALKSEQIVEISLRVIKQAFGEQAVLLLPDAQENLLIPPIPPELQGLDIGIAQWAFKQNEVAGFATNTLPANPFRYLPLRAPVRIRGILAIRPRQQHWLLIPEQVRQLETFANLIAIALERVHFVEVAQEMVVHIESERLRNSLLSALSHDLRTPLTALMGLAESLQLEQAQLTTQQQEIIQAITHTALHMTHLVHNLLDMVRIEEKNIQLHCELQVLEEIIGSAIQATRGLLGNRNVTVRLAPQLPLIYCDALLLERVFINLLENASKYTPTTAQIEITAEHTQTQVKISVADNGHGLPTGQEEAIFEKFSRGHHESATTGIGLGLTICRAIMTAHQGTITAHNRPQGGAVFIFTLPLKNIESCYDTWNDSHDFTD